ncbi:ATP-dependent helicase HrpB [Lysobacter helvus]|uniref:ATP-dependent helicase HrpB n=2 Tax=Lysobacteraceae TaxID=32033 RepID=A0ABN6FSB8_9GAMM|nr:MULTISPECIES: ATP-dependent helicase HrpB [Lysobacter]BCT92230.1 ATP-dependent helicase HrpB [Lysobacter caseinilyticus]BCT95383.1 ATP-dependent helicase HrpB [Lysobacter helvus]
MRSPDFPIAALLPELRASLAAHPRLVLEAPPGAGKTTQVPLALLDAPWLAGRKIVMLEPRRVAARAAAGFMAKQLGEAPGDTVGYRIRFESRISARTRVEVVTEGILTRMLQDDPMLDGVGALLFDEFHERHLAGDLGLALALDVQAGLREDLRIVVMSATLDGERLARFLDAPRLSSAGRSYPVEVAHFPARRDEALVPQARRAVEQAVATHPGDVLVFLPGQREIAQVDAALAGSDALRDIDVLALHGELPVEQQSRVLQPATDGKRRVVLATNVAESSVTLPGVRVVIDSGLAREPRYDPNSGFARLDIVTIAQASADQRAGRAGRVADGWALRLWPQSQRLEPQRRPEIAQVELASLALELAAWGSADLRFVDAPPPGALAAARDLLRRLGALDGESITPLGRRMLALGTHPRLSAMLLAPRDAQERALACDLAALVEARDPLRSRSDAIAERWRALAAFRAGHATDGNRGALAAIDAAAKQWRRRLHVDATPPREVDAHRLGDLLAHAFPDRIAHQHATQPRRYQLANGRMATLFDDSALFGEPWLVASELRFDAKDALLLRGAPVDETRLQRDFPERFVERGTVRWDADRRALVAQRERRFDNIVLDARPAGRVDPAQAARALTDAVRELGLDALPWSESLEQWRARVRCLRAWLPDDADAFPDLSDDALLATLDDWLLPAFAGKTRLDALDESALADALHSKADWNLRRRIEALAPTRIVVPSGMERRIEYAFDAHEGARPPVLAVKLQELFGLADTPRIVDGRVPLTLHLLSPGGRPLQVTQDLRGFWDRTYPDVRKEMKGRYPRHPWPDDPWSATATHRAKPRGT